jgi:hypothetical protein
MTNRSLLLWRVAIAIDDYVSYDNRPRFLGYIFALGNLTMHIPRLYWLPLIHFAVCIIAMLGYAVPQLQFLGILMGFVNVVDLPISLVAFALSFHHDPLAWIWIIVVGTLWWYLLGRAAQFLASRFRTKTT